MSLSLERRYRDALDWYPASWRADNGDAIVGTLLDEAEAAGRTEPRRSDLVNLALSGLGARMRRVPGMVPARVRDRAAAISLATGAVFSLVMFVVVEWAPGATVGPWNGWATDWRPMNVDVPGFGPFASAGVIVYALWMAAFLLAIVGLARTARFTLLATIPASLFVLDLNGSPDLSRMVFFAPDTTAMAMMAALAVVAMAGLPTRRGQRGRGATWIGIAAASVLALVVAHGAGAVGQNAGYSPYGFDGRLSTWAVWPVLADSGFYLFVIAAAVVVTLVARDRTWASALAVASVAWLWAFAAVALGSGGVMVVVVLGVLGLGAFVILAGVVVRRLGYRIVLQKRDDEFAAATVVDESRASL